jgi:hypothetical protein
LPALFQAIAITVNNKRLAQYLRTKEMTAAPNNTKTVIHIGEVIIRNTKAANLVIF